MAFGVGQLVDAVRWDGAAGMHVRVNQRREGAGGAEDRVEVEPQLGGDGVVRAEAGGVDHDIGADALDDQDAATAARLFKALSDPIRVQLVSLVRQAPAGEACFCDLADEFAMPQPTLSHHLKILVNAGILTRERRGTWSWYRIEPDPLKLMEELLRPGGPLRDRPTATRRRGDCD